MSAAPVRSARPQVLPAGVPTVLYRDAIPDAAWPAATSAEAISSHGVNLNALLFTAVGRGPHPTVLLLHGLPGNEQNLDLAQSLRRSGWNVLTLHYRGSWGTPGNFSFVHCMEDAAAAIAWLRAGAAARSHRIDGDRLVVIGHSVGGFTAAHIAATHPEVRAACLISGVDLVAAFGAPPCAVGAAAVDHNVGFSNGLHILSGTSAGALAGEAAGHGAIRSLATYAAALAGRPLLLITSDDGFAAGGDALGAAVDDVDGARLERAHFATDHSYSDQRIALQIAILNWLERAALSCGSMDNALRRPTATG